MNILTELCELCWHKIDEFNQFCSQVETIQASYNRRFLQENGNFIRFSDQTDFLTEIERIRNEFAIKIHKNQIEQDQKFNIEPFWLQENEIVKTTNDSTAEIIIDLDEKFHESLKIKQEHEPIELVGNTNITNTDLEDKVDFAYKSYDDDDVDEDDDGDEYGDDTASDMSFIEPKRKRKIPGRKSTKSNYETGNTTKQPLKKLIKKISMTAVNQDKLCDVCSDERTFDSFFKSIECPNECSRTFIGDRAYEYHISTGKCKEAVDLDRFSEIQNHLNHHGYIICCNRKFRRIGRYGRPLYLV